MAKTSSQQENHNAASYNNLLPQAGNKVFVPSETSVAGKSARDNRSGDANLQRHLTEEQLKEVAPYPIMGRL